MAQERSAVNPRIYRDRIVDIILRDIKKELLEELNIDIPEDIIMDVANSQFTLIPDSFILEETVKLDYLGKFKAKEGAEYYRAKKRKDGYGGIFKLVKTFEANENDRECRIESY